MATLMATYLLLLCAFSLLSLPCSIAKPSYGDHCGSVVPASTSIGVIAEESQSRPLDLYQVYCSVGRKLFSSRPAVSSNSTSPCSFVLYNQQIDETEDNGVLQVVAELSIYTGTEEYNSYRLFGFWSKSTGKICMIGSRDRHVSVVVKLNYRSAPNISTSLVTGTVERFEVGSNGLRRFDNISLLAYNKMYNYEYTLMKQAKESCSALKLEGEEEEALAIGFAGSTCSYLSAYMNQQFYISGHMRKGCTGGACHPLTIGHGSLPGSISFYSLRCSESSDQGGKLRFAIQAEAGQLNNTSMSGQALLAAAEGFWDPKRNRLCAVACPILENKTPGDVYVGECSIGISLWFPAVLTLKNRSTVVGRMWRNKKAEESGHFGMVSLQAADDLRGSMIPAGMKYRYTYKLDTVESFCKPNSEAKIGKKRLYPDGTNIGDMQFEIYVKTNKGNTARGYASVISVGDTYYGSIRSIGFELAMAPATANIAAADVYSDVDLKGMADMNYNQIVWNISYAITYRTSSLRNVSISDQLHSLSNVSISDQLHSLRNDSISDQVHAEGRYDASTGKLCMVGCRNMNQRSELLDSNSALDCQVAIHIQFAPLNPEAGEHISGTIASTRKKSDPLYFEPLEVSSYAMYTGEAKETIRRMDTEVLVVISSLTLLCMCIVAQLRHGKRNSGVLPSISMTMLVVLALGHMIPLVLNFEVLFFAYRRGQHNILLSSGRWLEVNEFFVRIMTMIAFLLQCWLLQMAFSARSTDEDSNRGLWSAEKEALFICFPLYLAGGLVTWFVVHNSMLEVAIVDELISYAGLVLDGFLLPQIVLNFYRNSKDKALTPFFYVGTTAVRVLPHLYDLYRSRHYVQVFYSSYVFAGPGGDFYSWVWDIIIPFVGVLFAVLLFLQQRFGGQCILPTRCSRAY